MINQEQQKQLNNQLFATLNQKEFNKAEELIANGANIHMAQDLLLYYGVYMEKIELIKFLFDNGVSIQTYQKHNITRSQLIPLALKYYNEEIFKYLVENGANIHEQESLAFFTALENENTHLFNYLVNKLDDSIELLNIHIQIKQNVGNDFYEEALQMEKLLAPLIMTKKLQNELNLSTIKNTIKSKI